MKRTKIFGMAILLAAFAQASFAAEAEYYLVNGENFDSHTAVKLENGKVHFDGINLTNPREPRVDYETVSLDAGNWTIFAKRGSKVERVYGISVVDEFEPEQTYYLVRGDRFELLGAERLLKGFVHYGGIDLRNPDNPVIDRIKVSLGGGIWSLFVKQGQKVGKLADFYVAEVAFDRQNQINYSKL